MIIGNPSRNQRQPYWDPGAIERQVQGSSHLPSFVPFHHSTSRSSDVFRQDAVFVNFVAQDPLGEAELLGGLALLPAAFLEGVHDELSFLIGNDLRERRLGGRVVLVDHLQ